MVRQRTVNASSGGSTPPLAAKLKEYLWIQTIIN